MDYVKTPELPEEEASHVIPIKRSFILPRFFLFKVIFHQFSICLLIFCCRILLLFFCFHPRPGFININCLQSYVYKSYFWKIKFSHIFTLYSCKLTWNIYFLALFRLFWIMLAGNIFWTNRWTRWKSCDSNPATESFNSRLEFDKN